MDDDNAATRDFHENVTVNKAVTIRAYDDDGTAPQVESFSEDHTFNITHNDVTIRGLDIYGANNTNQAAIYLEDVTGCTFENNRLGWNAGHKNYYGIKVYGWAAGNHLVADNTCSYNTKHGIFLANSFVGNNTVTGNTCQYNGQNGIFFNECWYNTVSSNNSSNNQAMGIELWISEYNLIKNNTFSSNDDSAGTGAGIWLDDSDNNDLFENTCENNAEQGISLKGSYNQLWNNDSSSNGKDGIFVYNSASSTGNTIIGNTFSSNNWAGIHSSGGADYNMFSGNTIDSNNQAGIDFWNDCRHNFVVENVISNHTTSGYMGLWMKDTSAGNRVYLNTFTNNNLNVKDDESHALDNEYNSPIPLGYGYDVATTYKSQMGNFYMGYSPAGGSTNGIWNTPNDLDGTANAQDPKPLFSPVSSYERQIWYLADGRLYLEDAAQKGGVQPIVAGATLTWVSGSAARSDVDFVDTGSYPWTGQVSFTTAPDNLDDFVVSVGTCPDPACASPPGFTSYVTWDFSGDGSVQSFAGTFTTTAAFSLPAGQYLAVTIENQSSRNYDLLDGGAWSFISAPDDSDLAGATGDFYVKNGGSDTFNGASWTTAYETIQFALGQAKADAGTKTIHVAAGTYNEALDLDSASDITLLGGYPAGGGTSRNPAANPTTIQGTGLLHTFSITDSQNITVDGFTITAGNPGGIHGQNDDGLNITGCTIQNNLGNVLLYQISGLSLFGNTIQNAVSMCGVQCSNCAGTIADNTIINNNGGDGAGIHLSGVNTASVVRNNIITDNTATVDGGGLYVGTSYNLSLLDNTISDNGAASGGGIFCTKSPIQIRRNFIQNNQGAPSGGNGAGVYVYETVNAELVNNVITGNTGAQYGGGVNLDANSTAVLTNNTIADNTAADNGGGVGLYNGASMTFVNGIVRGNGPDGIFDQAAPATSTTVDYSDVQVVYAGTGNISDNPMFMGGADYRLQDGSPCLDTGTSDGAPGQDVVKAARPDGMGIDMGAYEGGFAGGGGGGGGGGGTQPAGDEGSRTGHRNRG